MIGKTVYPKTSKDLIKDLQKHPSSKVDIVEIESRDDVSRSLVQIKKIITNKPNKYIAIIEK